jgi:DNA-directed RNA polymerase specialized sigma24 family protein
MAFVQRAEDAVDYQQLFVDHLSLIDHVIQFVVRRHQLSAHDGDEFASVVHLKIIENDYAILRKFEGRSHLNTYLATVIERLFLDHCRAAFVGSRR